jgi:ribose/xylose/arabinose/galactoside ABC-type transport system permease subunit
LDLLGFSLGLQGFATAANFLDLLRSISKLGILGLGMGLIVISRGIDLSEVAMMAGSWWVALTAIPRGLPPFWAAGSWQVAAVSRDGVEAERLIKILVRDLAEPGAFASRSP